MKKTYVLLLALLTIFSSCEEVIDVKVPSGDKKLVVDAFFEVYFNKQPFENNAMVKLRLSAPYFSGKNPPATGATVFIKNKSNNSITNFTDKDSNGNYTPTTSFIPNYDTEYLLTVMYNGNTYIATSKREKTTTFKEVKQGDKTLFSGKETEVKIAFKDNANQENYYRFHLEKDFYRATEDRFFNGSDYDISFFFKEDDIKLPTTIDVKMSGISKEYYTYFRVLLNQSGVTGGGPFQSVPSTLLGNIVNKTNKNKFALGYFIIADTDVRRIKLVAKEK